MSLSSAETSSCSRWGAWASRLRCLWTVQRWVGTSPQSVANACSSPVPPSTIRNSGLRSPRLTRSSRTARQASLVSPPHVVDGQQHLLTIFAYAEHDQEHDRGGPPVEPDPHHSAVEDQADDRFSTERAGIPGVPIALQLTPHPVHRVLADRAAEHGAQQTRASVPPTTAQRAPDPGLARPARGGT